MWCSVGNLATRLLQAACAAANETLDRPPAEIELHFNEPSGSSERQQPTAVTSIRS